MATQIKPFATDATKGAALSEYGLLAGLIAVVSIGAITNLGQRIENAYSEAAAALEAPGQTSVPDTQPSAEANLPRSDLSAFFLVNGDASDVSGAPWTGNFAVDTSGNPFFYGPEAATARSEQIISVPVVSWDEVDASLLTANLTWNQKSWNIDDEGAVEITYLDENGQQISSHLSRYLATTDEANLHTPRSFEAAIPSGARSIAIAMLGRRNEGAWLDAYFDDLDLEVSRISDHADPDQIRNPDGSLRDRFWAMTGGMSIRIGPPFDASDAYFHGGNNDTIGSMSQRIIVPAAHASAAETGQLEVNVRWQQSSWSGKDLVELHLAFFDSANQEIDRASFGASTAPSGIWTGMSETYAAPTGTHSVEIQFDSIRADGRGADGYIDNIAVDWISP